jgi:CP family cyanate transporter-like MFS transporter
VYGNGLLVAEAVAASLTLPVVLPLVGSWPWALAFWSVPLVLTVALTWRSAKAPPEAASDLALTDLPAVARSGASRSGATPRTWPNWGDPRTWTLGLVQGGSSASYFAANTFLPGYLHAIGKPDLVGITLAALNTSQLPGSFLLLPLSGRLMGRRWPIATLISVLLVATGGLLIAPPSVVLVPVTVIGLASSLVLLLSLALPAMWAPPQEVASLSAGMFSVGYTLAFVLPVVGGVVADAVGSTRMTLGSALVGVTIAAAATALLPRRIGIEDKPATTASVVPTSPSETQGPGTSV